MLSAKTLPIAWDRRRRIDGTEAFRLGRADGLLVAEWPGFGRLISTPDGTRSRFVLQRGADPHEVEKLRSGAVQALLGDVRGQMGLHASAVAVGGRAVLVLGESGAGKSTLAGELCVRHEGQLLADDMALLDADGHGVRVHRTERHHSLTRESCRLLGITRRGRGAAKLAVLARRPTEARYPLSLVAVLRCDRRRRRPVVRVLGGAEVVRALLPFIVRFDLRATRRRELDQILMMHQKCRVLEIARPGKDGSECMLGPIVLSELEGVGGS